jgi:deoxycytidine triphosphate deaminase
MLLNDADLKALLSGQNPPVIGVPDVADPFTAHSSIQAASLDLRIGHVFLPERKRGEGSYAQPIPVHHLPPGETAVVQTQERMKLPEGLAGLVLPPDKMSQQAVLITNPGHIDPGYEGPLKFTVINMGQDGYVLQQGDVIATLLLLQLESPAQEGWLSRQNGIPGPGVTPKMLSKLSKDFLDFEQRSHRAARKELGRFGLPGAALTILLSALAVGASVLPSYLQTINDVHRLEGQTQTLELRVNRLTQTTQLSLPAPTPTATPRP